MPQDNNAMNTKINNQCNISERSLLFIIELDNRLQYF